MIITLAAKSSNAGSIHDISDICEREIRFSKDCVYAVVPASHYQMTNTSHKTEAAAIKARRKIGDYSAQIIDRDGNYYAAQNGELLQTGGCVETLS